MWFAFWGNTRRREKQLFTWISNHLGADLHAHWLPAIDDGVKTLTESLDMLLLMRHMGWHSTVATPHILPPHYPNTPHTIAAAYKEVKTQAVAAPLPRTAYAAEYYADEHLLDALKQNETLLTFGKRYVLLELPVFQQPALLAEVLFELRHRAYVPVLAHPERYLYIGKPLIELWRRYDGLFQLNLLSFIGYYGAGVRKQAETLLKEGMADFVATDAHHVRHLEALLKKLPLSSAWRGLQRHAFKNSLCLL
ncbi:tyrosine-protein phosphatase [Thermonema rossianum]|uniref:tyrosine-protein phosphatase n=1 Tax=Thermonema rossianum TaxID=55505 RepID=UPI00068B58AE|nr:CpsB/CapC family capsule biosynthesis tyrosine phosphatase [Thermonema rossianum]